MATIDLLIVGMLLTLPQSYVLWIHSSEYGASPLERLWIFVIPGALVAARWLAVRRHRPAGADTVVVTSYVAVIVIGLVNALRLTAYPMNVLSTYGQQLYWLALVALFLKATAGRPRGYVLDLMRRYYVIVAVVGIAFECAYVLLGAQLPHSDVMLPDGFGGMRLVGHNYFVALAYNEVRLFGLPLTRLTFLFLEPRVLAAHLVVGIVLQFGWLWKQVEPRPMRRAQRELGVLVVAFVLANSFYGWMTSAVFVLMGAVALCIAGRFWQSFRALHAAFLVVAFASSLGLGILPRYAPSVIDNTARFAGKSADYMRGALESRGWEWRGLKAFPLGYGVMNLDSDRLHETKGAPLSSPATVPGFFTQNAGFVGVVLLGLVLWRLLGALEQLAARSFCVTDRCAAFLGGATLLSATVLTGIVLLGTASGPLLFGALLVLASERRAAVEKSN